MALAYPAFKKKQLLANHSSGIIQSEKQSRLISASVVISISLAIGFQLYQPISEGEIMQSISLLIGPFLFTLIAYLLYKNFQSKQEVYPLK